MKDGYEINVIEHDPPIIKGLRLKRSGIYLVFEGDDDYVGDEESLDESQLSISEKLSKFFSCLAEEDHTSQSDCVVESQVQAIEEEEEEEREISEPVWWDFLRPLQRCFCLQKKRSYLQSLTHLLQGQHYLSVKMHLGFKHFDLQARILLLVNFRQGTGSPPHNV